MASAAGMAPQTSGRGVGQILKSVTGFVTERLPGDRGHLAMVRHRIERIEGLPVGAVTVELWEGMAMLKGEVPTAELRKEVQRVVATVHPTRRINNFLRIPGESAA
ncbi:MAG: hypothetical protein O3A10_02350 [Chloroflexi bacterium]|nr:hypothetical protein [Chloroflexota bacterium]MDA1145254.1 hypothetical protein [Chloroflexota bacterium]